FYLKITALKNWGATMTFIMENPLRAIAIPGSVGKLLRYVGLPEAARFLLSAELVSSLFAVLLCLVLHLLDVFQFRRFHFHRISQRWVFLCLQFKCLCIDCDCRSHLGSCFNLVCDTRWRSTLIGLTQYLWESSCRCQVLLDGGRA